MDTTFGAAEFGFLLRGMQWTLLIAGMAFVGGGIVGLLVALARVSRNRLLRGVTAAYISVFQGTPLLMQLFVVYYGLVLVGVDLPRWAAVALAFTLHASAFLGDIWRGTIQALPRGQTEAAHALGLGYVHRMKDIVLPQALKIALPATIGFLVQLVKGTSLAAIIGFIELARAGQIVANQTYQPLLVFGVVGFLYFALCWPLSLYGARLEAKLAASTAR